MVLLEAMAYGLPILCSDIPGTRQVDLPEQDYFTVKSVDALADSLVQMLGEQPTAPVHYNLEKYDWQSIAAATRLQYPG